MKYIIDNDLHIHTRLSICSDDENQTPENILKIQKEKGFKTICLTDHYWDSEVTCDTAVNWWYEKQNYAHISQSLPLPEDNEVKVLFGCETDMDSSYNIGIPKSRWNDFDFIIISTTHFHHMAGKEWENCDNKALSELWIKRLDAVLDADLPFHKIGIAHLACGLVNIKSRKDCLEVFDLIPDCELVRLFSKAAKLGVGIELNYGDMKFSDDEEETILRIFKTAKNCGCKFYLGSDAHSEEEFKNNLKVFERAINLLNLTEEDKFRL